MNSFQDFQNEPTRNFWYNREFMYKEQLKRGTNLVIPIEEVSLLIGEDRVLKGPRNTFYVGGYGIEVDEEHIYDDRIYGGRNTPKHARGAAYFEINSIPRYPHLFCPVNPPAIWIRIPKRQCTIYFQGVKALIGSDEKYPGSEWSLWRHEVLGDGFWIKEVEGYLKADRTFASYLSKAIKHAIYKKENDWIKEGSPGPGTFP